MARTAWALMARRTEIRTADAGQRDTVGKNRAFLKTYWPTARFRKIYQSTLRC